MIKEWLLARILKNKIVFFEEDNEYKLINDIEFDGDVIVCRYYNFVELEEWLIKDYLVLLKDIENI